jgi:glucokinase
MTAYLIIDAGGTFLKSAVLDSQGEVLKGSEFSVNSSSEGTKEEILRAFRDTISKGLEVINRRKMKTGGIGIAFPGPFDIEKATPLMKHKFQSIYGMNLRECFCEFPGVPGEAPIRFIHDANAVLVGELWKGNARGYHNAAVVTLGTGLGFAISEKGKVLCNELGGPFLSIFKIPYKEGILEDYTAKRGFLKIYSELSGKSGTEGISVSDIGNWANKGDTASIRTFERVGEILAKSLKQIIIDRKIECLLFSGQISRSFLHLEASLKEGLKDVSCLKKVSAVKSIDNAALWGALRNIKQGETKLNVLSEI